jgi:endonuclease/exonuclease/phosphatase family metal-dependent hydrolase
VPTIRVLTYNVRSLRDDPAAVGRVMRELAPDVACIQEAPRFLRWRSACAALARRAGLVQVTGGRSAAANLVLSRLAVDVEARRDVFFDKDRRLHQRGTAMALLRLGGARFAVAGTHLDGVEGPRLHHIGELREAIDDFVPPDVPVLIGADVNDIPGSPSWDALLAVGADAFAEAGIGPGITSNVAAPTRRIDAIFADRRFRVLSAEAVDSPDVRIASDHFPVLAEVQLPDPVS